jgi:hydrogenase small subunit
MNTQPDSAPVDTMTRRSFLQLGARLAAAMGLGATAVPALAEALSQMASGALPALWLQGQSCSGCSVSLLNGDPLTPDKLLTQYISLAFHQTLSGATGNQAVEVVNRTIEGGGYVLLVEGAVPSAMPNACRFGEETFSDQLTRAARNARAVIAVGSCASWGGIPASENNPTGSVSVPQFLDQRGVRTPKILIPGCPAHPDWLLGTVAHVLKLGIPPLDELGRPKAFYGRVMHDQCPRFADYEREHFAQKLGDPGCLFKLGCQGPLTKADCNLRQWNSGTNTCIKAGAPCIGCAWEKFSAKADFPFFLKSSEGRS